MYLPRNAEKFIINPKIPLSGGVVPVSLTKRNVHIIKKEFCSDLGEARDWQFYYGGSSVCLATLNYKDLV